jgi:D-glycero-D-manno-heptose 1,7-bisphosphate phosphatase
MNRLPRLVILELDGVVVNGAPATGLTTAEDWVAIPGSLESIARLNHAGIIVAIVSVYTGIGNGTTTLDEVNRSHARLHNALARCGGHVDGIFFCPHTPDQPCECRLPAPGLLRSISLRFNAPLQDVVFFCHSANGREAGIAAKAEPVLIGSGELFQDLAGAVERLFGGSSVA